MIVLYLNPCYIQVCYKSSTLNVYNLDWFYNEIKCVFNFKHKLHDLKSFYTLYKYVETCHVPESLWVKLTLSCDPVTLSAQYSLIIYDGDAPQKETFRKAMEVILRKKCGIIKKIMTSHQDPHNVMR